MYSKGTFVNLQKQVVVIGPAEDGGYVLIGLDQLYVSIFNKIPWGTDQVLKQTRNRLRTERIQRHDLVTLWDVD